jgi:hypothetical protein
MADHLLSHIVQRRAQRHRARDARCISARRECGRRATTRRWRSRRILRRHAHRRACIELRELVDLYKTRLERLRSTDDDEIAFGAPSRSAWTIVRMKGQFSPAGTVVRFTYRPNQEAEPRTLHVCWDCDPKETDSDCPASCNDVSETQCAAARCTTEISQTCESDECEPDVLVSACRPDGADARDGSCQCRFFIVKEHAKRRLRRFASTTRFATCAQVVTCGCERAPNLKHR